MKFCYKIWEFLSPFGKKQQPITPVLSLCNFQVIYLDSANGITREIKVKGQKLGTVTSFRYLGAIVSMMTVIRL